MSGLPEDFAKRLNDSIGEVRELVQKYALRGPLGALPANAVPVPEIGQTLAEIPPSWRKSLKHGVTGKVDDWHTLLEAVHGKLDFHFLKMDVVAAHDEEICTILDALSPLSLQEFDRKWPQHLSDDVYMCLEIIVLAKFLGQDISGFAELLRRSYQAGGAPCGWLGKFPEGRLIVFWPYEQEPEFAKD